MQNPNKFPQQIFEVLSFSIDQACNEFDWYNVSRDALAFGFDQTDISTDSAYAQRFDLALEDGFALTLVYQSFDPSRPFTRLPATSKFELTMTRHGEVIRSHQNSFDEPVMARDKTIWHELSFA